MSRGYFLACKRRSVSEASSISSTCTLRRAMRQHRHSMSSSLSVLFFHLNFRYPHIHSNATPLQHSSAHYCPTALEIILLVTTHQLEPKSHLATRPCDFKECDFKEVARSQTRQEEAQKANLAETDTLFLCVTPVNALI